MMRATLLIIWLAAVFAAGFATACGGQSPLAERAAGPSAVPVGELTLSVWLPAGFGDDVKRHRITAGEGSFERVGRFFIAVLEQSKCVTLWRDGH